ncbi:MAG TPA: M20/M25/M40 family metallo-hydrolase [Thermoanaerobaculia bacterium]|nr:M20/M25/M40 family metallo-hydrolase [Thermoanaerobaculia bacterium]
MPRTSKRKRISSAAVVALALAAAAGHADGPPRIPPEVRRTAESLRERAFTGTRAIEWARGLVDTAGSRLSGSPGDKASIAWGVATLRKLGFANVRAEKLMAPYWVRGVETGEVTAPYPHKLFLTALGGSVPTVASGLEAEILEVGSLEELDAKKQSDVRGKIVFFNKKMQRTLTGEGYGKAVDVRSRGASHAAKLGAAGVIIRSVGTDSNRTPHTGGLRYLEGIPKIPAAAVSNPDADLLERLGDEGKPVRVRFTLGCRDMGLAETANVIGEMPGRGSPKEIVVLACHRDAWELGTGAEDDAAGCAIVIEAARLIGGLGARPRRTIRVVLYANEENGLAGGRAYAADHAAELPLHAAALEADLGSGRPIGFSWNAGSSSEPLMAEISSLLEPLGAAELTPDGLGGADISPLVLAGVPLFAVRQEASRYFDLHHTANDTFDKIDVGSLDRMTAAVAAFAYVAASTREPFEKIPAHKRKLPAF